MSKVRVQVLNAPARNVVINPEVAGLSTADLQAQISAAVAAAVAAQQPALGYQSSAQGSTISSWSLLSDVPASVEAVATAQPPNVVLAGRPTAGSDELPTFRALVPLDLPAATDAALGVVKPDGTVITVTDGAITVPAATDAALGVVKPDGTVITVTDGAITVPAATDAALGVVKPDGSTITVSEGVISAVGGGGGTVNVTPDTHPAIPTDWDDEFEYGTSIDTSGARFSGANAWTWANQGSTESYVYNGYVQLSAPPDSGGTNHRGVYQALPTSGTWTFATKIRPGLLTTNATCGISLMGTGSSPVLLDFLLQQATSTFEMYVNSRTGYSGGGTIQATGPTFPVVYSVVNTLAAGPWVYLQISYNGTDLVFSYSMSGQSKDWVQLYSVTPASSVFGGMPTYIFLWVEAYSASYNGQVLFDWFRRTA